MVQWNAVENHRDIMSKDTSDLLMEFYRTLYGVFGPQHWWPGETPLEIAVGAILTQNTNWGNVEKAISNLKQKGMLNADALYEISPEELARLIRPSGYNNVKAKRLKYFSEYLVEGYGGNIDNLIERNTGSLRQELLHIHGIGEETADSILLYALNRPVFVIDAYTRRVLSRHNLMEYRRPYGDFQNLIHASIDRDVGLFNEFHALFVKVGKHYCRTRPLCNGRQPCPLRDISLS